MVKAAVIGLGKIGLSFDIPRKAVPKSHVLAYLLHPDFDLVAAVGVRQSQGEQLAQISPHTAFYLDTQTMLSDHAPDVISICTPSHIRFGLIETIFAHASPKLLFIEKPVALTIEEADRIKRIAMEHQCEIVVNHSRRWSDGAGLLREKIRSGEYGKLQKVHLRYSRGIYNTGSHLFDLVRFVAGTIAEVKVVEQVPTNLDDKQDWTYSFLFKLAEQSCSGYAEAFDDRNFMIFEMDLYFEKGKIEYLNGGDEIRCYSTVEHLVQKGMFTLHQDTVMAGLSSKASNIANAVKHVHDIVVYGVTPDCTIEDGIYPIHVAEALIRSNENNGTWEPIGSVG